MPVVPASRSLFTRRTVATSDRAGYGSATHGCDRILGHSVSFKQIVCQQESLAATYGAGISNACVVDLGAVKTSVACVDDGLVLNETRFVVYSINQMDV